MTTRDEILARVRANQPAARPLPDVSALRSQATATVASFKASLERMGGAFVETAPGGDLGRLIRELHPEAGVICSATPEVAGNRSIDAISATALDDVDVGVVRARFGIAETGSVWLSEAELRINALAFLSQHLVVLLDPADIVADVHDAYLDPGFREASYAVLMSGPSATADIEGVLIRGAQGIRSMTVVGVPRSPPGP
jgi:L-lactate dehydrogenase complex protein LldG